MTAAGATSRTALVTGAASGIGAAIAVQLAASGLDVALLDRDENGLVGTRERCGTDANVLGIDCDVREDEQVAGAVQHAVQWTGRIDVVINAAGVLARVGTAETTADVWQSVLDINLTGTFRVVRAALPHLVDERTAGAKRVVNIGSGAADRGYAYPAYTASKGGVVSLTRELAAELAPHAVTVNAINPGFIRTAINDDAWSDDVARARCEETIPLGRMGRPEDVAAAASFLASDGAGYITGEVLRVDGGRCAVSPRPA